MRSSTPLPRRAAGAQKKFIASDVRALRTAACIKQWHARITAWIHGCLRTHKLITDILQPRSTLSHCQPVPAGIQLKHGSSFLRSYFFPLKCMWKLRSPVTDRHETVSWQSRNCMLHAGHPSARSVRFCWQTWCSISRRQPSRTAATNETDSRCGTHLSERDSILESIARPHTIGIRSEQRWSGRASVRMAATAAVAAADCSAAAAPQVPFCSPSARAA